jgi:uncharacterized protein (TIGR02001 family)
MTSRFVAASAACVLLLASASHAADVPPVTGNVAGVSDYMFRGLTQTWGHPAIQGGVDYAHPDGFAAGAWASSISDRSYPGGSTEVDLYASFGRAIDTDWSWRAGLYGYVYPGANLDHAGLQSRSFTTLEANAALTWRQFTLKYNRSLTDYFAADTEQGYDGDTRGTGYLQLDVALPLNDLWSLALHAGDTHYTAKLVAPLSNGARNASYTDESVTLQYQFATHWAVSGGITHADDGAFYGRVASFTDASETRDVGGTRAFVMFRGTF